MDYNLSKFKHKHQIRVRNFEVDSQGIVHNAIYLEYCEIGRVEYIRQLGFKLLPGGTFGNDVKVRIKRNEITYYNPAKVDDLIDVYSRIAYIKNSSFCFEHILINTDSSLLICFQKSIHVNLNLLTNQPERVADEYRKLFSDFEGPHMAIIKD